MYIYTYTYTYTYIYIYIRHRAAIKIQTFYRSRRGHSKVHNLRKMYNLMARKIQRLYRAYYVRYQRAFGLSLCHILFHSAAVIIQCSLRMMHARAEIRFRIKSELYRESVRLAKEHYYISNLVSEDIKRTNFYLQTAAGKLHKTHVVGCLKMEDEGKRLSLNFENFTREQALFQEASMAFKFLNRSGNGRLNKDEMRDSLIQLSISISKDKLNNLWYCLSNINSDSNVDEILEVPLDKIPDKIQGGTLDEMSHPEESPVDTSVPPEGEFHV
jgi:hypothetical protein